eukprot:4414567-Amphidinium_carterae.1
MEVGTGKKRAADGSTAQWKSASPKLEGDPTVCAGWVDSDKSPNPETPDLRSRLVGCPGDSGQQLNSSRRRHVNLCSDTTA